MSMYNLLLYSSNDSNTTGDLWFYSKDEAFDIDAIIVNINNFKSFKYKAKLLENTFAQSAANQTNGIQKDTAIAVPLKYLSNFWRLIEMTLIKCKVELKLRWTKHYILPVLGVVNADNDYDSNADNIIFTIKETKLNVLIVTLSAKDNQKVSKLLSKGYEVRINMQQMSTDIFLNQTL